MLTDPQLACLAVSAGPLFLAAMWSLGDICGRAVGGCDTPADPADLIVGAGLAVVAFSRSVALVICRAPVVLVTAIRRACL